MKTRKLHRWNLSYARARRLQSRLASRVQFSPLVTMPKVFAGLDCAFSKDGRRIVAAIVVLKLPDFEQVETAVAVRKVTFPYIPGLLSFREAPACIDAVEKLRTSPDVFIVDGQGYAHPRRFGIACHIGILVGKPTVGCAKSRLIGTFDAPAGRRGSYAALKDDNEVIGAVLRTRSNIKPVFVSVGNKCTLQDAISVVLECTTRYRLPEPSRLAHQLVTRLKVRM